MNENDKFYAVKQLRFTIAWLENGQVRKAVDCFDRAGDALQRMIAESVREEKLHASGKQMNVTATK